MQKPCVSGIPLDYTGIIWSKCLHPFPGAYILTWVNNAMHYKYKFGCGQLLTLNFGKYQ